MSIIYIYIYTYIYRSILKTLQHTNIDNPLIVGTNSTNKLVKVICQIASAELWSQINAEKQKDLCQSSLIFLKEATPVTEACHVH